MRIPLDYICVRTGVLCPRCERLVSSGVVKRFEVDIMRALLELEEKPDFRFLRNAEYVKSVKSNNITVLILSVKDVDIHPRILSRLGRALSDRLKLKVKVINKARGGLREIAGQLIFPARVIGVNTLWLPDGTVEHIIRIPRSDSRYLPSSTIILEQLLARLIGVNVRIRTEG